MTITAAFSHLVLSFHFNLIFLHLLVSINVIYIQVENKILENYSQHQKIRKFPLQN